MSEFRFLSSIGTRSFRFLSIAIFGVVLSVGCSNGRQERAWEEKSTSESMFLSLKNARPLEVISVIFPEKVLSKGEYKGTIGGEAISLTKVNASTLVFVIPREVPAGSTELSTLIDGITYEARLNVLENVEFSDPRSVFIAVYDQRLSTTKDGPQAKEAALARLDALSEEEQWEAVQILLNNKVPGTHQVRDRTRSHRLRIYGLGSGRMR